MMNKQRLNQTIIVMMALGMTVACSRSKESKKPAAVVKPPAVKKVAQEVEASAKFVVGIDNTSSVAMTLPNLNNKTQAENYNVLVEGQDFKKSIVQGTKQSGVVIDFISKLGGSVDAMVVQHYGKAKVDNDFDNAKNMIYVFSADKQDGVYTGEYSLVYKTNQLVAMSIKKITAEAVNFNINLELAYSVLKASVEMGDSFADATARVVDAWRTTDPTFPMEARAQQAHQQLDETRAAVAGIIAAGERAREERMSKALVTVEGPASNKVEQVVNFEIPTVDGSVDEFFMHFKAEDNRLRKQEKSFVTSKERVGKITAIWALSDMGKSDGKADHVMWMVMSIDQVATEEADNAEVYVFERVYQINDEVVPFKTRGSGPAPKFKLVKRADSLNYQQIVKKLRYRAQWRVFKRPTEVLLSE